MCFEKLIVAHIVRKFTIFHENRGFRCRENTPDGFEPDLYDWDQNNWSVSVLIYFITAVHKIPGLPSREIFRPNLFCCIMFHERGLSGKNSAFCNISITSRMAFSHSEETLVYILEQSLSRGVSQSSVGRH